MDFSLDALLAELATAAPLDPPEQVSRRWHQVLATLPPPVAAEAELAEAQDVAEPATVVPRSAGSRRATRRSRIGRVEARRGRVRRAALAFASAAAVAGVLIAGQAITSPVQSGPSQQPGPAPTLALKRPDQDREGGPVGGAKVGACLARFGLLDQTVLAARRLSWHGRPAIQIVLATPVLGRFHVVTVSPDCGPGSGRLLAYH